MAKEERDNRTQDLSSTFEEKLDSIQQLMASLFEIKSIDDTYHQREYQDVCGELPIKSLLENKNDKIKTAIWINNLSISTKPRK